MYSYATSSVSRQDVVHPQLIHKIAYSTYNIVEVEEFRKQTAVNKYFSEKDTNQEYGLTYFFSCWFEHFNTMKIFVNHCGFAILSLAKLFF